MKIIYLLPPSEGKNLGGEIGEEHLSFIFEKPLDIAINATQKDLKCKGARYEEGIELNKNIRNSLSISLNGGGSEQSEQGEFLSAISRYSGVMYNAINYSHMSKDGQKYFENNFKILSGMYGILEPLDTIGNYKLPIETKGLYKFWGNQITDSLDSLQADYIVDMLPASYAKMIDWKNLKTPFVKVDFLSYKDGELKKITHGVKKVKGEYIYKLCNNLINNISDLEGSMHQISESEYALRVIS